MNSQSAWIPASKRTTGEKPRTKLKMFFSFITPDLKARRDRRIKICVLRALIQQPEERTERRCPNEREESTDQECAGGACAKMCALRKSG
jgi:hypothetical protein